ncbi:hypothetical protein L6452_34545 [Arctium lappa]|uniref:Uncharacterized protein n=1 Tax=Arctium lappa TaxID=4217 RepID=A0ACB8YIR5_ARCLA|nr:hypothetical protein L6452_34545 [Arctium lappa]
MPFCQTFSLQICRINELPQIGVQILKEKVEQGLTVAMDVLNPNKADDVDGIGKHLKEGYLTEAVSGMPSSSISRRVFFKATNCPVCLSFAL